jgi:uncharacterized damage-inducible protein DinB
MGMVEGLLSEFDMEMQNTRKVLERVPMDKSDWKPHAKSGNMGWLAWHVAYLPAWLAPTFTANELDLATLPKTETPKTREELLAFFDKNVKDGRAALANAKEQAMGDIWTLKKGPMSLFAIPRVAVWRGIVMNHLIHHRAQLGVYLRLNDVPVPALYGPSADENPFG